jgi:hypothetical protein
VLQAIVQVAFAFTRTQVGNHPDVVSILIFRLSVGLHILYKNNCILFKETLLSKIKVCHIEL